MRLPILSHPTTAVLVDDSDSFLKSLSFQLDPLLPSKTFHDTSAALDWFARSTRRDDLPLQVNFDSLNQTPDQPNVAVDMRRIHRICEQPLRFTIPSVLVVDYSMPQMNGIEFCQALQHLPTKKILFTGAADEKIAVDAFNRGLIDRYIKKSDDDALDRLEVEIGNMQRAFFLDHAQTLADMLALHDFSFLRCQAMAAVVQDLYRRHGFVEHYLYPGPAGILFFDRYGRAKLMVIETEQGMCAQYEVARDNEAPHSLLLALSERRVLPFFPPTVGDGMYSTEAGDEWHRHCRPPQVCQGREKYYWALFDFPLHYLAAPPAPFEQYLNARQAASCLVA
jgi:CheY-like chemotaxis protein